MPPPASSVLETAIAPSSRSRGRTIAAALCVIAGVIVWVAVLLLERNAARDESVRLLARFATDEETALRQAAAEGRAQLDLDHADRGTRLAFLQRALKDSSGSNHLDRREQGFFVSLSHVRSSEARALFEDAVVPALRDSFDPAVLRESIELMQRWNSADVMSASESDRLAEQLVARMLNAQGSDEIAEWAAGVGLVAKRVSVPVAAKLASQLAARSITEPQSNASDARLPALLALEQKVDKSAAEKLVRQLVHRMFEVQSGLARRTLAQEASELCAKLSATTAGEIAGQIVDRASGELDSTSMKAWMTLLAALKAPMGAAEAGELAVKFAPRVVLDLNNPGGDSVFTTWAGLAAHTTPTQAEQLAAMFSREVSQPKTETSVLQRAASLFAALPLSDEAFAKVSKIFIGRVRAETEPAALSNLASAVAVLREKLPQADVEETATILTARMISERDGSVIGRMAGVLDDLDEGLGKTKAGELAAMLAGRMNAETRPAALLGLAAGFIAVAEQMDHAQAGGLGDLLLSRMRNEDRADVLRTLAFSLGSIADGVKPAKLLAAGDKLAASMETETDSDDLRALAAGLYVLKERAGSGNFKKAATVLASRIRLERDASGIHDLVASLQMIGDLSGKSGLQESAKELLSKVFEAHDATGIRAAESNLALILPDLENDAAAEAAASVVAQIAAEQNPDRLRAYGEILSLMPEGSLKETDLAQVGRLFAIPNAPCQVATLARDAGPAQAVPQILNPLCSETSWALVVAAFDGKVKRGIVHQGKKGDYDDDEATADFKHLVVADDDDESSADAVKDSEGPGIVIDFNKLSDALDGLRPPEPILWLSLLGRIVSLALVLAGGVLLYLGKRNTGETS